MPIRASVKYGTLAGTEAGGDPLQDVQVTSYIYGGGRAQHCSALMANPADLHWYDRHGVSGIAAIQRLMPSLDSDSQRLITNGRPRTDNRFGSISIV